MALPEASLTAYDLGVLLDALFVALTSGGFLVDGTAYLQGTVDPSAGGGVAAPIGSLYSLDTGGVGSLWVKVGAADTAWTQLGGGASTLAAVLAAGASANKVAITGGVSLSGDAFEGVLSLGTTGGGGHGSAAALHGGDGGGLAPGGSLTLRGGSANAGGQAPITFVFSGADADAGTLTITGLPVGDPHVAGQVFTDAVTLAVSVSAG